jgi:radical SAM protein with 4Fe4S-binding SPASM domain
MYGVLKENVKLRLDPEGAELIFQPDKKIRLNRVAVEIVELINSGNDIETICKKLATAHDDTFQRAHEIVSKFLDVAKEQGYVSISEKPLNRNIFYKGNRNFWIPQSVSLEVTSACNLACKHCYAEAGAKKEDELGTNEQLEILKKLKSAGVANVNITGGEPLVCKDIFKILDYSFENFRTVLLTNGYSVDEDVAQKLSRYKNMLVQISLDGSDSKTHDYIRGINGSFDRAVNAIKLLKNRGLRVIVSMTTTPFNIDQIEKVLLIAKENGAMRFRPGPIVPSGRAKTLSWEPSKEHMKIFKEEVRRLYDKYNDQILVDSGDTVITDEQRNLIEGLRNCGAGYTLVAIAPNGDVRPCTGLPADVFYQGNIYRQSVDEVFGSKMSRLLFELQTPKKSRCNGCDSEYNCGGCLATSYAMSSRTSCDWYNKMLSKLNNIKLNDI